jgi:hypothetical protein
LILLCQSLVFEEDNTALFFTAFIFMMISVAILYAIFRIYKKKLQKGKIVEITCQSLALLSKKDVMELFQASSVEFFEKNGMFNFSVNVLEQHFKAKPKKDILRGSDNTGYILKSNIDIILKNLPQFITELEFDEVLRHAFPNYHLIELDMNRLPHLSLDCCVNDRDGTNSRQDEMTNIKDASIPTVVSPGF